MHRVAELLLERLVQIIAAELHIFVDRAGYHTNVQALRLARLAIDVEGEALLAPVAQPLLEAESVALRLGDLLALFVEEHLVIEALGRAATEDARDLARLGDAVDQILARHLVVDPERDPACRPVDLPLQLGEAAERRLLDPTAVFVIE